MKELAILVAFFLLVICFWVLLFYTMRQIHGISLRTQFRSLADVASATMERVMSFLSPKLRRGRKLSLQHERLCRGVRASETVDEIQQGLLKDPMNHGWITPEDRREVAKRKESANMDLRVFLGRLSEYDVESMAAYVNRVLYGRKLGEIEIQQFLFDERDMADDASNQELSGHLSRYLSVLGKLFMASC